MSTETEDLQLTMTEESDDLSSVKSDDQSSVKSDDSSGSSRVKFLYSYGGRILPRPADGKLRYVGGETRVVAAYRNISFADLSAKMAEILGSSVLLKCQLPTQDLDALVSIKSDEDLENILEEYDRLAAKEGSSKVRAFLFPKPSGPSKSAPLGNGHMVERAIVQSHDEGANGGYVAGSIPSEPYRPPQISQEPQDKSNTQSNIPLAFKPRGSSYPSQQKQHAHDMPHKAGRPPRCPPVHPDAQYNIPVRYAIRSATQIHDRVKMPPQQKYAARAPAPARVDDGRFVRVDQSACARVVYSGNHRYISPPPPAQIQFPGKAVKIPPEQARKAYQYVLHNPYSQEGGGLQGFRACEQFLVQH